MSLYTHSELEHFFGLMQQNLDVAMAVVAIDMATKISRPNVDPDEIVASANEDLEELWLEVIHADGDITCRPLNKCMPTS